MNKPVPSGAARPPVLRENEAAGSRRRWFVLGLLTLVQTLSMADRNIMMIAQESIKHEFSLTDGQVGMLSGMMFGVTYAIASIPMGILSDRMDRARLLAIAQFLWSGATALIAAANGFLSLLGLRFIVGLSEATCVPACLALIADHFPQKGRSTAFSIFYLGVPLGACFSLALGGLIIAQWGWRTGFLVAGAPGLIVAAIILVDLRRPAGARAPAGAGAISGLAPALRTALSSPAQRYLLAGLMLVAAAAAGVVNWAVPFLIREHHLPLSQAGLVMGITMGLGIFGLSGAGALFHRLRDKDPRYAPWFAAIVALAAMAAAAVFILSPAPWLSIAGLAVVGCIGYSHSGPIWAVSLNLAHKRERGVMAAVLQMLITFAGYGLGTLLVGKLSDLYGGPESLRWAMLTITPLYLGAAAMFAGVARHLRADLAIINREERS